MTYHTVIIEQERLLPGDYAVIRMWTGMALPKTGDLIFKLTAEQKDNFDVLCEVLDIF